MINDEPSLDEMAQLWQHCMKFIEQRYISCPETIYQSDRVIGASYGFVRGVCEIVGYASPPVFPDALPKEVQ